MFDVGFWEFLALAVIALIVFGPEKLPTFAAEAGRMLRELRRMAQGAKDEVSGALGPEFSDLQLSDLDPRSFVKRQLLEESDDLQRAVQDDGVPAASQDREGSSTTKPYDGDAT